MKTAPTERETDLTMADPGTSMHIRRQMAEDGLAFPFRLARVSFPHLKPKAISYDVEGGYLVVTRRDDEEFKVDQDAGNLEEGETQANGITFRCPGAMNGLMYLPAEGGGKIISRKGGEDISGEVGNIAKRINDSFKTTYKTTSEPALGVTSSDFRSTNTAPAKESGLLDEVDSETDDGIAIERKKWTALYNLVGETEDIGDHYGGPDTPVRGSQLDNVARKKNRAAHADIARRTPNTSIFDLNDAQEIIEIVKFERLPVSNYNKYLDYGNNFNRILEDPSTKPDTKRLQNALKKRSVEILKTIINSYETKDDTANAKRKETLDGKTMPNYTINEQLKIITGADFREDDQPLRFWRSYPGEVKMREGIDVWKFALFEWEPLVMAERGNDAGTAVKSETAPRNPGELAKSRPGTGEFLTPRTFKPLQVQVEGENVPAYKWPDVFPDPAWKNSFVMSRLVDLRYNVATAFMLDDDKIQQYWAWCPERADAVSKLMLDFHDGVKNQNLDRFEPHRIDTFDILQGFNTKDNQIVKLLMEIRGITYDIFNKYKPDDTMIQRINKLVLPIKAISRDDITINMAAMGAQELQYLNDLPALRGTMPKTDLEKEAETVWAYSVGNAADGGKSLDELRDLKVADIASSGMTIYKDDPKAVEKLKARFDVQTITSNYKMSPIVAPVVNRMLLAVRQWINNRTMDEITKNPYAVREIEEKFSNWFAPKTNVYLQFIFGQALDNALTPAMIGSSKITNDVVLAYRTVAQKLLDSIAFAHTLGQREALHVFHVDVCNKLIKIAQTMDDPKTEEVMQQVAYAVCVEHRVAGLPGGVDAKRRSYKTISANVDVLRNSKAARPNGAAAAPRITDEIITVGDRLDYPDVKQGDPATADAADGYTADPKIWRNYDYWALVLLDQEYFKFHTYGTINVGTLEQDRAKKTDLLDKLTHEAGNEFEIERAEPELSRILRPNADRYEDYFQKSKRMGESLQTTGGAPQRRKKNSRKALRKKYNITGES